MSGAFNANDFTSYNAKTGELDIFDNGGADLASVFLDSSVKYTGGFTPKADATNHLEALSHRRMSLERSWVFERDD